MHALQFFNLSINDFYQPLSDKDSPGTIILPIYECSDHQPVLDYFFLVAERSYRDATIKLGELLYLGLILKQPIDELMRLKETSSLSVPQRQIAIWFTKNGFMDIDMAERFQSLFGMNSLCKFRSICIDGLKQRISPDVLEFILTRIVPKTTLKEFSELFLHYMQHYTHCYRLTTALINSGMDPNGVLVNDLTP